jgi:ubiquitin-protein ligase
VDSTGQILSRTEQVLEVNLSLGYPRRAPQCRMLTPVFHPNFDPASVCIGDFWAASEWLDDLVIRIGRMIAYQEYNTKSPLNGLAARWAAENPHFLPIDPREIAPSIVDK